MIDPLAYTSISFMIARFQCLTNVVMVGHIQSKYLEMLPDIILNLFDEIIQVDQRELQTNGSSLYKKDACYIQNFATASALVAGRDAIEEKDVTEAMLDLCIFSHDTATQSPLNENIVIGGYSAEKSLLEESTVWFYTRASEFANLGIRPPKGALLYGPPGCGKTLLCKSVASKCKATFVAIRIPEIVKSYVGESEKAIVELFKKAKQASPCILFLDEIDALFSGQDSDLNTKISHQFCAELDALDEKVVVLAATNYKNSVHPSILSPGRIDRSIYIGLPTPQDRREIIKLAISKTTFKCLEEGILSQIVERTAEMTGSEIVEYMRKSYLLKLRQKGE